MDNHEADPVISPGECLVPDDDTSYLFDPGANHAVECSIAPFNDLYLFPNFTQTGWNGHPIDGTYIQENAVYESTTSSPTQSFSY